MMLSSINTEFKSQSLENYMMSHINHQRLHLSYETQSGQEI